MYLYLWCTSFFKNNLTLLTPLVFYVIIFISILKRWSMNLNNLKVGGRYKNYKVLCEALEESSAGGKKKMYLLRKLA